MTEKITVSINAFEEFEKEVQRSLTDKNRTRGDVTNKEVLSIIDNPGCEIEVIDAVTKKVVGTVCAGLGAAGLAAAAVGGSVVAGIAGGTAFVAGTATASFLVAPALTAAGSAAVAPGIGWIIAGGILAVTAIVAAGVAVAGNADKKKAEDNFNLKQKLFQDAIMKQQDEIRRLKKDSQEHSKRCEYLICLLNVLQPQPV